MSFSETIKELRAKKKITQRDLASRVGISSVQLNRYEKGTMRPRLPILAKLAEVLDVDYSLLSDSLDNTPSQHRKGIAQTSNNDSIERIKSAKIHFEGLSFQEKILFACHVNNSILMDAARN